jgi:hypothetical protein
MYSYVYRCKYFFVSVREARILRELDFLSRRSRGRERARGGGGGGGCMISELSPLVVA